MRDSSTAIAAVASTPAQAKVFVAMLEAEGIPAFVEGDSLADEVAISRRLMNLSGVQVRVPAVSLDRAKEVLATSRVDEEELAAAALAATEDVEQQARSRTTKPNQPGAAARRFAWIASFAALLFFVLWQRAAGATVEDGLCYYVNSCSGVEAYRLADRSRFATYEDADRNGVYEVITLFGTDEQWLSTHEDADQDGHSEKLTVARQNRMRETWVSSNDDGRYDRCVVTNADGAVVQELRWHPDRGFVVETR